MTSVTSLCPHLSLQSHLNRPTGLAALTLSRRFGFPCSQRHSTVLKTLKKRRSNVCGRSRETVFAGIKEDQPSVSNGDSSANIFGSEDLVYFTKLGGGCILGACLIKYGSLVFPSVTAPNLLFALLLVASPPFFALIFLSKASRS